MNNLRQSRSFIAMASPILVGLVFLGVFVFSLGSLTTSANHPFEQIVQVFLGIAFLFAFGLGVPESLAYVISGIIFFSIFWLGFWFAKKFIKIQPHPIAQHTDKLSENSDK